MTEHASYRYGSLTAAIEDKTSPLRAYLDQTFPYMRDIRAAYQRPVGPLLVEAGTANPGTLGAAFDFTVRMILSPSRGSRLAIHGFIDSPEQVAIMREVAAVAERTADCRVSDAPEELLRACWVFALSVEIFRMGMVPPGSPLAPIFSSGRVTASALLEVASDDALAQLGQLHSIARDKLYPALPDPVETVAIGPTFSASSLCAADADFIVDGLLMELKTRLGPKNKAGLRSDALTLADAYQLLGYLLFDHGDEYKINRVGYYSGRYGNLTTWTAQEFLDSLAGRAVDIASERGRVWQIIGGNDHPERPTVGRRLRSVRTGERQIM